MTLNLEENEDVTFEGHAVICYLLKRIPRRLLQGVDRQSRTGQIFTSVKEVMFSHCLLYTSDAADE